MNKKNIDKLLNFLQNDDLGYLVIVTPENKSYLVDTSSVYIYLNENVLVIKQLGDLECSLDYIDFDDEVLYLHRTQNKGDEVLF